MIKALDFTKGGDESEVTILYAGGKEIKVKKKFVEPTELFETGVYNSEMDANTNPKTDENAPDQTGALVSRLTDRLTEIVSSLDEIRLFIKDNSSLSHDSIDKCIDELKSYSKSLEDESKESASGTVN